MPAETMISILAATLLATGWLVWIMPVGTCAQCNHCLAAKLSKERATEAQVSRVYGLPPCIACGQHHRRGGDHRP